VNEQLLVDFFRGAATAAELGVGLLGARVVPDSTSFRTSANYRVTPLLSPVEITPAYIDALVGALAACALTEEQVGIAVFLMEAQPDRFLWDTDTNDGERIADVVFWLSNPAINYPLTPANLAAFRHYLRTGEQPVTLRSHDAGA
jgi:hypothetical protein